MNPTIKLIAAFAVGFAIPAMAASEVSWYPVQDARTQKCAVVEKKPVGDAIRLSAAAATGPASRQRRS